MRTNQPAPAIVPLYPETWSRKPALPQVPFWADAAFLLAPSPPVRPVTACLSSWARRTRHGHAVRRWKNGSKQAVPLNVCAVPWRSWKLWCIPFSLGQATRFWEVLLRREEACSPTF